MKTLFFILLLTFQATIGISRIRLYSFNEQCRKATEIFTGRIIQMTVIEESGWGMSTFRTFEIKFVTFNIWKGLISDTMTCIAAEGICSPNIFEVGKTYLIYSTNGSITLGSGRSGEIKSRFVRSDMRKLTLRYLFRRPEKTLIKSTR